MIHRTFTRAARPGDLVRGDVLIPDGPPPRSAVVVVHGFKGFKDWGFFPHACRRLAGAGHAVVSFNFSRNGVGADLLNFIELDRFASDTLSLELEELQRVFDWVCEDGFLPRTPGRLGLLGHSRGGGLAVLAASTDSRVDSLVTWAAVADFDRWSEETKAQWREDGRLWILNQRTAQQMPLDVDLLEDFESNRARLDVRAAAAAVRAPWLIVHGADDMTVRPDDARALDGAAQNARMLLVDGAGHTFETRHPFEGSTAQLDEVLQSTVEHFARTLAPDAGAA